MDARTSLRRTRFKTIATITTALHSLLGRQAVLSQEMFGVSNGSVVAEVKLPQELAAEGRLEELRLMVEDYSLTLRERDEKGDTLLHAAARENQVDVMEYLIENEISLDATDSEGNTALHIAVTNGHVEALHLLLNSGASDTILNGKRHAPSHIVVQSESSTLIAAFFEHQVAFNIPGFRNRTPLHVIAEHNNLTALSIICRAGASKLNYCACDYGKLSPLHVAARRGSHQILDAMVVQLKQHGHNVEHILELQDSENSTPLHAAIDGGSLEAVRVLLKHGSNPTISREDKPPPLLLACAQGKINVVRVMVECCGREILQTSDHNGRTLLHFSTNAINSAQMIEYLTQNDVNVDAKDNHGQTALHSAIHMGSLEAARECLSSGADPLSKDNKDLNALHYAVLHNRMAIMNLLLRQSSASQLILDVNSKKESPVHLALKLGFSDALLKMTSVVQFDQQNTIDDDGNNFLHLAAAASDWKALSILLEFTPLQQLNHANSLGFTPLHAAAKAGNLHCVQLLLSNGAVSHKCHLGFTPFLLACREGHTECAQALHDSFSYQKDWTNVDGNSALHLAAMSGNPKLVSFALDADVQLSLNSLEFSFFELLIESIDAKSAMAVVKHPRWQECLDFRSPTHPHLMLGLIVHMPDVAQAVLDRCHTKAPRNPKEKKYWEKFDFRYLRLAADSDHKPKTADTSLRTGLQSRWSLRPSTQNKPWSPRPMEVMQKMIEHKCTNLLTHPVVKAYLVSKWNTYGRPMYAVMLSVIFFLALFLSIFVLIAPAPFEVTKKLANASVLNSSLTAVNVSSTSLNNSILAPANSSSNSSLSVSAKAIRILVLILAILELVMIIWAAVTLGFSALEMGWNGWIWVHIAKVVCIFVFLVPTAMIWEAGALAVCLAWFAFAWDLQLIEHLGIYTIMFLAVTRTVLQVLFIAIFFFLAFAFSLYILARNIPQFSEIGYSMFTVFGYMLGEIDYDLIVLLSRNGILHCSVLTFLIIVSLALLLTIVMANLLVGLAVDDIEKIRFNAVIQKIAVETKLYSKVDPAIPKRIMRVLDKPNMTVCPNVHISFIKKSWLMFWHTLSLSPTGGKETASADDHALEISLLRQRLDKLTEVIEHLNETLQVRLVAGAASPLDLPSSRRLVNLSTNT